MYRGGPDLVILDLWKLLYLLDLLTTVLLDVDMAIAQRHQ